MIKFSDKFSLEYDGTSWVLVVTKPKRITRTTKDKGGVSETRSYFGKLEQALNKMADEACAEADTVEQIIEQLAWTRETIAYIVKEKGFD